MIAKKIFSLFVVAVLTQLPAIAGAASAQVIDANVDAALERFAKDVEGAQSFLNSAKGVLVFPKVIKAGLIIAGEFGEGALRIDGKTVQYYNTGGGSFGLQVGGQEKSIYIMFMTEEALNKFRESSGWEAGVDGAITLVNTGAAGAVDTTQSKSPIVGFVTTNAGLMADISLAGSKYTKINPKPE
jgi:lipid-binding SYLF domain-containing protein